MAELRLDPMTRRWVVTGKRPLAKDVRPTSEGCPFCPGNEQLTPKSIVERKDAKGAWMCRVFHDRAPVFRIEGEPGRRGEGIFDRMNTLGAHEIVVETPQHGVTIAQLPVERVTDILEVCRDRILDLKKDRRFRYVSLFKDQVPSDPSVHGHAHAQILATQVLPIFLESEFRWSRLHFERKERCLLCDILNQELRAEKRIVDQNPDFVALCPFASRSPYELWILPLRHASSFENDLPDRARVLSLASFLKSCLQRVERISEVLHEVVHTEPNREASGWPTGWWQTLGDDFHWHIEINPDVEGQRRYLGSEGLYFNPIPAEEAALVLRALTPEEEPPAPASAGTTQG